MHHNRTINSMIFQFVNLSKTVFQGLYQKPDDQVEWFNILQLICHIRQALACSMCGQLLLKPYTPTRENCHCICSSCRDGSDLPRYTCSTCKDAFSGPRDLTFVECHNIKFTANSLVKMCKLIIEKRVLDKWANLRTGSLDGPVTLSELVRECYNLSNCINEELLGHKFRKKYKEREHFCRCGSGNKGKSGGNLTCLGQRCACYKEGRSCTNCKCQGCKNPNNPPAASGISPHRL